MEHDPISSEAGHKIHIPVQPGAHREQVENLCEHTRPPRLSQDMRRRHLWTSSSP